MLGPAGSMISELMADDWFKMVERDQGQHAAEGGVAREALRSLRQLLTDLDYYRERTVLADHVVAKRGRPGDSSMSCLRALAEVTLRDRFWLRPL